MTVGQLLAQDGGPPVASLLHEPDRFVEQIRSPLQLSCAIGGICLPVDRARRGDRRPSGARTAREFLEFRLLGTQLRWERSALIAARSLRAAR